MHIIMLFTYLPYTIYITGATVCKMIHACGCIIQHWSLFNSIYESRCWLVVCLIKCQAVVSFIAPWDWDWQNEWDLENLGLMRGCKSATFLGLFPGLPYNHNTTFPSSFITVYVHLCSDSHQYAFNNLWSIIHPLNPFHI